MSRVPRTTVGRGALKATNGYRPRASNTLPDLSDVHAWYDFSEYDPSTTSNIPDLSENSYTLDQGTISGYTDINGVQAGLFDGVDDGLWGPTFSAFRPATVHAVAELDPGADSTNWHMLHSLRADDGSFSGPLLDFRWDPNNFAEGRWSVWDAEAFGGSSDTTTCLFTIVYGPSGEIRIRENGTLTGSHTGGEGRTIEVIGLGSMQPENSGRYWHGALGEWTIYPYERSSSEIDEAESYLADKWGVSI